MSVKFLTEEWAETLSKACNAHPGFAKATKGQQATIVINVANSPAAAAFTMVYDDGTVTVTTGAGEGDVNLALEYPTMVELSKGTINGPEAIAGGKMTAEGDMGKMFGLGKAMELLPTIEANLGLEY